MPSVLPRPPFHIIFRCSNSIIVIRYKFVPFSLLPNVAHSTTFRCYQRAIGSHLLPRRVHERNYQQTKDDTKRYGKEPRHKVFKQFSCTVSFPSPDDCISFRSLFASHLSVCRFSVYSTFLLLPFFGSLIMFEHFLCCHVASL